MCIIFIEKDYQFDINDYKFISNEIGIPYDIVERTMSNIKFISYDGEYPCLCMGTLKLNIDGKDVIFSDSSEYSYVDKNNNLIFDKNCYPKFWKSGGCIRGDFTIGLYSIQEPWKLNYKYDKVDKAHPQWIKDLLPQLLYVFNANVPQGCCGGCL